MVFHALDVAAPDLLREPVDDLDAGEVALVHRAVEGLARKRLLVHGAVGIAVEEAAELVLQLADSHLRFGDELPGKVLVVEPLAALDGVHEMALDGIAFGQRHVVAALHHARAAAFAEQALHRHRDLEPGRGLLRMQRRKQPGAAGAEDQDVGVDAADLHAHAAPMLFRTASRRLATSFWLSANSEPPCESMPTRSGPKCF